jgi:uncharacterized iron-regulated membrane protein
MIPWPLTLGDYLLMAITIIIAAVIAAIVIFFVLALLYEAREKVELWRLRRTMAKLERDRNIPRVMREKKL